MTDVKEGIYLMIRTDLVRFLALNAGELLERAEGAAPAVAQPILDEAEELLVLGAAVMARMNAVNDLREAA